MNLGMLFYLLHALISINKFANCLCQLPNPAQPTCSTNQPKVHQNRKNHHNASTFIKKTNQDYEKPIQVQQIHANSIILSSSIAGFFIDYVDKNQVRAFCVPCCRVALSIISIMAAEDSIAMDVSGSEFKRSASDSLLSPARPSAMRRTSYLAMRLVQHQRHQLMN